MTPDRYTTSLPELDALLGGGFRPGTVNLIAGSAASGKTTLVDTIVRANAVNRGVPTLLIDGEYNPVQRDNRILAGMAEVPVPNTTAPDVAEATRLHAAQPAWNAAPLAVIEARTAATVMGFVRESSARLIAVDSPFFRSYEAVEELRKIANSKDAAVVVTTQVRDAWRHPMLHHLPSRQMAEISDAVVMLSRFASTNRDNLVVAKARAGRRGEVSGVVAQFELARFVSPRPSAVA